MIDTTILILRVIGIRVGDLVHYFGSLLIDSDLIKNLSKNLWFLPWVEILGENVLHSNHLNQIIGLNCPQRRLPSLFRNSTLDVRMFTVQFDFYRPYKNSSYIGIWRSNFIGVDRNSRLKQPCPWPIISNFETICQFLVINFPINCRSNARQNCNY